VSPSVCTSPARKEHDRNPPPDIWFVLALQKLCFLNHLRHLSVHVFIFHRLPHKLPSTAFSALAAGGNYLWISLEQDFAAKNEMAQHRSHARVSGNFGPQSFTLTKYDAFNFSSSSVLKHGNLISQVYNVALKNLNGTIDKPCPTRFGIALRTSSLCLPKGTNSPRVEK